MDVHASTMEPRAAMQLHGRMHHSIRDDKQNLPRVRVRRKRPLRIAALALALGVAISLPISGQVATADTTATDIGATRVASVGMGDIISAPLNIKVKQNKGTYCSERKIYLASGNYKWEQWTRVHPRLDIGLIETNRTIYLRAGDYRWRTCISPHAQGGQKHTTWLTEAATGGSARLGAHRIEPHWEVIIAFASTLRQM